MLMGLLFVVSACWCTSFKRQTAGTAHLESEQLLLFAFSRVDKEFTRFRAVVPQPLDHGTMNLDQDGREYRLRYM